MKDYTTVLQEAIAEIVYEERMRRGLKFTIFCYENDFPTTTYYMLERNGSKSSAVMLFKAIHALGLSFEEYGARLDEKMRKWYAENDEI